jgi:dTDP-4-amino-4,6-dideoxygalactose transaminase
LNKKNIGAGSHYPIPCHLQEGYKPFIKIGSELSVSEDLSSKLLSLPLDESINSEKIAYVCQELVKSIKSKA